MVDNYMLYKTLGKIKEIKVIKILVIKHQSLNENFDTDDKL